MRVTFSFCVTSGVSPHVLSYSFVAASSYVCTYCKVSCAAALAQHSHKGELVIPRRSPREPHLPVSRPKSLSRPSLAPVKPARSVFPIVCIALLPCDSHFPLFPLTPSSSPITASHGLAHAVPGLKFQDSTTRSHPRRDLPSVHSVRFRLAPVFSFLYCSPFSASTIPFLFSFF